MMFTCHEQNSYSVYMQYSITCKKCKVNFIFLLPLFTYLIAQHKWWTQKEQVCLLAAVLIYLRLMHNDCIWLYCTLFRHHRNVMEFVRLYAAVAFSPFLDEGKEQRLAAASCVFSRNATLSSPPSFLICVLLQVRVLSFMYITAHAHFGQSGNTATKTLHACILRLIRLCLLRLWA